MEPIRLRSCRRIPATQQIPTDREKNTMHAPTRALAASALTIALVLTGCAAASEPATNPSTSSSPTESSTGGAQATGFNQDDVMFAMNMIAHHQQAIEMSDTLLAKSDVDERVAELAERIRAAQQPEIERMNSMLEAWGEEPMEGMEGMDHGSGTGGGMMSEADMTQLEEAPGAEASSLFLEQMIVHHDGAVEMAETEVDAGENADAVELAERIISDQSSEIAEMEALLDEL